MKALKKLSSLELILLHKQIELGKNHLMELLGEKDFQKLLDLVEADPSCLKALEPTDTETAGNLILAVNAIITGCFGGWMGLSAVMELGLNSHFIFMCVFFLAALAGTLIGYQSFKFTKNEAISATQKLQFIELEIKILQEVRIKKEEELKIVEEKIRQTLCQWTKCDSSTNFLTVLESFQSLCNSLLLTLSSHHLSAKLETELRSILHQIEGYFFKNDGSKQIPSVLKKIISSTLKKTHHLQKRKFKHLIVSLIPTLFGGFGSLFVYFSGGTQIAKAFSLDRLVIFLTNPTVKKIEILLAICITLYFGFCFLYGSHKSYQRKIEIKRRQKAIVNEEASLTILDEKLFKAREILYSLHSLNPLFEPAKIDSSI